MNSEQIDSTVLAFLNANLPGQYETVVKLGEWPYQANREALKAFDIKDDERKGRKHAELVVTGINRLMRALKGFEEDATEIAKRTTTLRPPEDHRDVEEGGPETGDNEEGFGGPQEG